ncbi:MAG: hypothetical protein ACFCUQ_16775 [Kiloniellales bacterium]
MFRHYPQRASRLESAVQLVLLISLLAFTAFYATLKAIAPEPDAAERIAIILQAVKITGVSFLLSLGVSFLRMVMKETPLVLIWGALLVVAVIAWALACLILLSAL